MISERKKEREKERKKDRHLRQCKGAEMMLYVEVNCKLGSIKPCTTSGEQFSYQCSPI